MKKTKIISFQQIKKWTLLGVLIFIFGGGLIFIPDFSFGQLGNEGQKLKPGIFNIGALKQEEQKKLYEHTVKKLCSTPKPYDLNKEDKEIEKEYQEKQSCAEKSWLKDTYNESLEKKNKVYKKELKAKDDLAKKQPKEQCKDNWKKQAKQQKKAGEKGFTKQRGDNPTTAGEGASVARFASVTANNDCARDLYDLFKPYSGEAMEKQMCKDYPKKCMNGEYRGGTRELQKYVEIYKSQIEGKITKRNNISRQRFMSALNTKRDISDGLESKAYLRGVEKRLEQRKIINKAKSEVAKKTQGSVAGAKVHHKAAKSVNRSGDGK